MDDVEDYNEENDLDDIQEKREKIFIKRMLQLWFMHLIQAKVRSAIV